MSHVCINKTVEVVSVSGIKQSYTGVKTSTIQMESPYRRQIFTATATTRQYS